MITKVRCYASDVFVTLCLLFLVPTSLAGSEAEGHRLAEEMTRLAQRNAWGGVERKYNAITHLKKFDVPGRLHLLGAQAARGRGDIATAFERAQLALTVEPLDQNILQEASIWLADFMVNYGEVSIELSVAFRGLPALQALDGAGFNPKVRDAIDIVNATLTRDRTYTGFLPIGRYKIGDTSINIYGGPRVQAFVKPVSESPTPGAAIPLPDERPPDRIITLAVRGGGWKADSWPSISQLARDALYTVEGVLIVDAFQPENPWVIATPDPVKLEEYGLDMLQLASTLQLALDQHRLVTTSTVLAFPPNTVDPADLEAAIVGFAPESDNDDTPIPIRISDIALVNRVPAGPYPMPHDSGQQAVHRFEIKVRGGTSAVEFLLPALRSLPEFEALGIMLEAQEVR